MTELGGEGWRNIAAMNARVYAMTAEDREAWYAEHPVASFVMPARSAADWSAMWQALKDCLTAQQDAASAKMPAAYELHDEEMYGEASGQCDAFRVALAKMRELESGES